MGYTEESLRKPIVGICYTESGFNNCHRHFPELLEAVKRGVLSHGALPVPFPVTSLGEVFLSPTSMLFRNLMAMDVEEMIRAQPMDSVVLMGGCDKTVPALLMGAISANKPAVMLVGGAMMTGPPQGRTPRRLHRLPPVLGTVSRGQGRCAGDHPGRGPPRGHGRHLRSDGNGQHHGCHRRDAWPGPSRLRLHPRRPRRQAARRGGNGGLCRRPCAWGADAARHRHERSRSTMRCGCCWPSPAPPMRCST